MRTNRPILLCVAAAIVGVAVQSPAFGPTHQKSGITTRQVDAGRLFAEAAQLYQNAKPESAAARYEELLAAGYRSKEVYYNLANSCLLAGRIPPAILNYRQAWRIAPRDTDIAANLQTALTRTGTSLPMQGSVTGFIQKISVTEWIVIALVSYWASALLATLRLAARRQSRFLAGAVLFLWCALAVSLAGILAWTGPTARQEAVLMQTEDVRLAPSQSAISHFPLQAGTILHVRESSGEWLKVSTAGRTGWIPKHNVQWSVVRSQ